jgi:hypothetical protein
MNWQNHKKLQNIKGIQGERAQKQALSPAYLPVGQWTLDSGLYLQGQQRVLTANRQSLATTITMVDTASRIVQTYLHALNAYPLPAEKDG